ncbi:sugar ABC transporter substrate-binding protein, partial [Microbacteriaceae bacterium K1510]|nr:sugar ABC transporter substrate-binding protein [Microbacteriaceae bacterium K1510]
MALTFGLALAGCGGGNSSAPAPAGGPITINQELSGDQQILSKGPHGETAVSAKTLKLTEDDVKKIQEGKYKAALVMHYAGNDWATAQI